MFKVIRIIVHLEIPEGTSNYEHHWPKWKPTFITLGDNNAKALIKHINDTYTDIVKLEEQSYTQNTPIYNVSTLGAGSEWNPERFNLITLGSTRTCRGEYAEHSFTCLEYQKEANEIFELKQIEANRRETEYYSQLWV